MTAFSEWISSQPELWTEEMDSVFGPRILREEDLTDDEAVEGRVTEEKSGGRPAKRARGAEAAEDKSGGGQPAKRGRGAEAAGEKSAGGRPANRRSGAKK
jgi:hypothetical protein